MHLIKRFSGLIIIPFLFAAFSAGAQGNIDILHYRFRIELNDRNDSVYGKAEILLLAKKGTGDVEFDLSDIPPGAKKGMSVVKATLSYLNTNGAASANGFRHLHNKLGIHLQSSMAKDDTLSAFIEYRGIPSDGLIISMNKFGQRCFFADNWPDRARNWIPCVDDPGDKASVEFIVTAPLHYQVVSNGVRIEESNLAGNRKLTHWKEDVPLPTKVMVIGVADFAVQLAGVVGDCIPVSSWVFTENRVEGFHDYSLAPGVLSWLVDYIGPYPYRKLANVQSKTIFGGMENASAIFYFENSVTGKQEEESLFAHEMTHQWFGNSATEKSFAHLWLSEGFATYLTHLYLASRYGRDSLNKRMNKDRNEVISFSKNAARPVVDNTTDFMRLLNPNSYQKGSWVLHMLRRQVGDSVFRKCIRSYYAAYAGKNADSRDFQRIVEKESGLDLDIFFRQWLYRPENPSLKISWKYLDDRKSVQVSIDQLQKELFVVPLDIRLGAGASVQTLAVSKRSETFLLPMNRKPLMLIADPDVWLLSELQVTESK